MNTNLTTRDRRQLVWPALGIIAGVLVATNPFYAPNFTLSFGIAVWGVAMVLACFLSGHLVGLRAAAFLTGLLLAVPCFVRAMPLSRGLLMCCMFAPVAAAAALVVAGPIGSFRVRLAYLFSWSGKHQVKRCAQRFDVAALVQLIVATVVLAAAIATVKAIPGSGLWWSGRWLAGGIMIFAFAEMATAGLVLIPAAFGVAVPMFMRSPYRSASIGEFWTKRWNVFASETVFRPYFFAPLARHGVGLALCVVFFASGVAHALLAYMAIGQWGLALMCGAFFVVQPILIAIERQLNVRHWRLAAGRAWTLSALAITSPLFVEPALQLLERSWGEADILIMPTIAVFGFVVGVCVFISLASLWSLPGENVVGVSESAPL